MTKARVAESLPRETVVCLTRRHPGLVTHVATRVGG